MATVQQCPPIPAGVGRDQYFRVSTVQFPLAEDEQPCIYTMMTALQSAITFWQTATEVPILRTAFSG